MKFILTGCTGFIGGEVLAQCLRNPSITSIVALSRRDLPTSLSSNPKLQVVVIKNFNSYPDSIMKELSGADACIWCMGTTVGEKVLEIDYPLAFGNAFSKTIPEHKKTFRYVHLSGGMTERDQEKSLWFMGNMRKTKGAAENNMLGFAKKEETQGLWKTLIVKAGFVITRDGKSPRDMLGWMLGPTKAIRVNELAATMIDAALNGFEEDTLQDNDAMMRRGREVLLKSN